MSIWPKESYEAMLAYYGPLGEHQKRLLLPYPMRLAWQQQKYITAITCHEKVAASLERVLKGILLHYGSQEIMRNRLDMYGGCLNVRKMRVGHNWSIHNWGSAIDLDPEHNQIKWDRKQATMPDKVIEIFCDEGWISAGHERNADFMHFQAARL